MIDYSKFPLSPKQSSSARKFLGLSQSQASAKSGLGISKLKRFETAAWLPDFQFVEDLRNFFESEGVNFNDGQTPGARAHAAGDIFQAGVIGELDDFTQETAGSTGETTGSIGETVGYPNATPAELQRPQMANLQYLRISPSLKSDQIDRIFDCIEDNEAAIAEGAENPIVTGFLESTPSTQSQALAVSMLRRLAENGLLYARLMGRDLLPAVAPLKATEAPRGGFLLFSGASSAPAPGNWKTVGELMRAAMADVQLAFVDGDKPAQARRKARIDPKEVLQALVG